MTTTYQLRNNGPQTTWVLNADECVLGRIVALPRSFRASRRYGTADDVRRVGYGFRTIEAAAEWIAKGGVS